MNPAMFNTAMAASGIANIVCVVLLVAGANYIRRQRHKLARQAEVVRGYADELHDEMERNDRLQVENEGLHRDLRALRAENTDLLDGRYEESPS
jgi:hypothetical protein